MLGSDGKVVIQTELDTKKATAEAAGLGGMLSKGLKGAGIVAGATAAAIGVVGGAAIKVGMSFEQGMSKVQAISGATGDDLQKLTDKAKEMGAKTKFTATEAAEAFEYMAMAGWKTEDMLGGIDGVLNLAAASGEDLGTTSDIVTDALTALKMEAKDAGHFADVLAAASSNANTNVSMMGETFKYAAPLAGTLGFNAEDTAVAIGLMANSGIKASQAGTALRGWLARMASPTDTVTKAMKTLGISLTDKQGQVKPLKQLMEELREAMSHYSEAGQAQLASDLAGKNAMSGLLAIVNASEKDYQKLTKAVQECDGAAEGMANTMQDNLGGQITILKSSLEGLGLALYDGISKSGKDAVVSLQGYVNKMTEGVKKGGSKGLATAIGSVVSDLVKKLPSLLSKLFKIITQTITSFIDGLASSMPKKIRPLFKLASDLSKSILPTLKTAFKILGGAIMTVGTIVSSVVKFFQEHKVAADLLKGTIIAVTAGYIAFNIATNAGTAALIAHRIASIADTAAIIAMEFATGGAKAGFIALTEVMNVNPFVLLATAIVAVGAGLIYLASQTTDTVDKINAEIDAVNRHTEALDKELEKTKEVNNEVSNSQSESQKKADAYINETNYLETLVGELDNLVDAQGNVKKGEEDHVNYILGTLNGALGTEYKLVNGQVQGYDKLQKNIYKVLKAKELENLMAAAEEQWTTAKQNYAKAQEDVNKKYEEYRKTSKENQDAITKTEEKNRKLSESYTDLSEKEKYANGVTKYYLLYKKNKIQEEIDANNKLIKSREDDTKKAKENYETAKDTAGKYYAAMIKYQSAYQEAAKKHKKKALELLETSVTEFNKVGKDIAGGVANGMYSQDAIVSINDAVKKLKDHTIKGFRVTWKIGSPSKVAEKEAGRWIGAGVAVGIVDGYEENNPFKQLNENISNGLNSLQNNFNSDFNLESRISVLSDYIVDGIAKSNLGMSIDNREFARIVKGAI